MSTVSGELVSILRYADVAAVLRNPQISVDDRASQLHQGLVAEGRFSPAYLAQLDDRSFLHRDPPDHSRLRKLAARAFTARRVEALRAFIQQQVDQPSTPPRPTAGSSWSSNWPGRCRSK